MQDFEKLSVAELDAIHEAIMQAREKKQIEFQNELIGRYQALREEMIKNGVAKEDELPVFRRRGWKRGASTH
jgi:hypothetical protein